MRELIEKIIQDYDLPTVERIRSENYCCKETIIAAFMDFGKQVCEFQKVQCAVESSLKYVVETGYDEVDEDSILNSLNVCDYGK